MHVIVLIFIFFGVAALVGASLILRDSPGAVQGVQEIQAILFLLIAAVLLVGAGIIEALFLATERLWRRRTP
jgi:hypothetical protein